MSLSAERAKPGAAPPPTILCAGLTRFAKPCTNRVSTEGGFCGRCASSRTVSGGPPPASSVSPAEPVPPRRQPGPPSPIRPDGPDNEWTIANELVTRLTPIAGSDEELLALVEIGARLAEHSRAANTKSSYRQHWRTFVTFCETYGLSAELPVAPEVVSYFVAYLASAGRTDRSTGDRSGDPLSHGYLRQALGAIGHRHTINGMASPTEEPIVRSLLEGFGKLHGTDVDGKDPLRSEHIGRIVETLNQPHPTAGRDLAICLLATHPDYDLSASTLSRLDGGHLQLPEALDEPMVLLVTRQGSAALHPVEIHPATDSAVCPVGAMRALSPDPFGPAFRSAPDRGLSRQGLVWIVTNAVEAAGIDPASTTGGLPRLSGDERRELSKHLTQGPAADLRDRALITNLYWGCFRASELVERTWRHVRFVDQGIEWRIPRAKNDQDGSGHTVGVPRHANPWLCPVLALDEWKTRLQALVGRPLSPSDRVFPTLDRRSRLKGPMGRDAVNEAVKRAAARATLTGDFGSHSLRSGFTTDAIDAGAKREHVQHHGRWKNVRSLDPYYRKTNTWGETNPAVHLANSAD